MSVICFVGIVNDFLLLLRCLRVSSFPCYKFSEQLLLRFIVLVFGLHASVLYLLPFLIRRNLVVKQSVLHFNLLLLDLLL